MKILSVEHLKVGTGSVSAGFTLCFKIANFFENNYVYILHDGSRKYFQILKLFSDSPDFVSYTAVECGYGKDKLSSVSNLDIRTLINKDIFIVGLEEEAELRKRSSYT